MLTPSIMSAGLRPDASRVVAQLFLPGEQPHQARSRAGTIAARVMALSEAEVEATAAAVLEDFSGRHHDFRALLQRHAAIVAAHVDGDIDLSEARTVVLGASVTSEYATEAAALCNPSAVLDPDQGGLAEGQVRVVLSLRAIGEGHVSSIAFCCAVIGPGERWEFDDRARPLVSGATGTARWTNAQLRAVLAERGPVDELGNAVLQGLAGEFDAEAVQLAIVGAPADLLAQPGAPASIALLRRIVYSAYVSVFPADSALSQRILRPNAAEESDGMEDARFTRFVADDGEVEYRATYTAYDGRQIAPRLLRSPDLRTFRTDRLAGSAARNKGMALFPRLVDGRHLALCRSDGETISLAASPDGLVWSAPTMLHRPTAVWEMIQVGNCGPPIETDRGWLVLTHGVGPMRRYVLGALLLDLDDPSRVTGRLTEPLLAPAPDEQDGYVPNVLYTCGGLVHDGRLWFPYGIGDSRIGVACVPVADLLDALLS